MTTYMTEEEQIERIKKWWSQYGNIVLIFITILMLIFLCFRYWNWHHAKITTAASNTYEKLMISVSNNDQPATQAYAKELTNNYKNTIYAHSAYLMLAKLNIEKQNFAQAKKELEEIKGTNKFSSIAKLRLARILVMENNLDMALSILNSIKGDTYLPLINEMRGDIYTQMKRYTEASKAYQQALTDQRLQGISHTFLEMKNNEISTLISSMAH